MWVGGEEGRGGRRTGMRIFGHGTELGGLVEEAGGGPRAEEQLGGGPCAEDGGWCAGGEHYGGFVCGGVEMRGALCGEWRFRSIEWRGGD